MNNPITKAKKSKVIGGYNFDRKVYFTSQKECSIILGVSEALVSKSISRKKSIKPFLSPLKSLNKEEIDNEYILIKSIFELQLTN